MTVAALMILTSCGPEHLQRVNSNDPRVRMQIIEQNGKLQIVKDTKTGKEYLINYSGGIQQL